MAAAVSHGLEQLWALHLFDTQQRVRRALTAPGTSEQIKSMHYGDLKPSWQFLRTSCECELGRAGSLKLRGVKRVGLAGERAFLGLY